MEDQGAKHESNVLYYVPVTMGVHGRATFAGGLLTSTIVQADANFFNQDPKTFVFGEVRPPSSYRPIQFDGRLTVSHVRFGFGSGGETAEGGSGIVVRPIPDVCRTLNDGDPIPAACPDPMPTGQFDGLPDVELFDRSGAGAWHRLPHPVANQIYDVANPERYVDPTTGTLVARYVNDSQDQVAFAAFVAVEGSVR